MGFIRTTAPINNGTTANPIWAISTNATFYDVSTIVKVRESGRRGWTEKVATIYFADGTGTDVMGDATLIVCKIETIRNDWHPTQSA